MIEEANKELEKFSPEDKNSRDVLRLKTLIYGEVHLWQNMLEVSRLLVSGWPEESDHWVCMAHATRQCGSIAMAELVLLDALDLHDAEPLIHYNLACYAAQTGRLVAANEHLVCAVELDPGLREVALEDEDLKPLWS